MLVTKTIEIDMGHRVPNHKSKCRNLHGHRYKIEVGVDSEVIETEGSSEQGMVIDFGDLKSIMMNIIDGDFDHGFVMSKHDILYPLFYIIQKGGDLLNALLTSCASFLHMRLDGELESQKSMKIIFVDFIPTAENLSKHWYELLDVPLKEKGIDLSYVKVWETPTSTAVYDLFDKHE
jgi:6-pyruvoyltetrahydropterin/6-carboxytetrahydropterin synthase